jgi:hypothetical protein
MEGVEQRPGESKKEAWSRHMDEWKVGQQLKGNEWAIHMAGWKGEQAQAIEQHGKDMEAWQADQVAKKEDWEQHMSDWRKDQGIPEPKVSLPKAIGETGIEAISGGRLAEATAPTGQGQQQDQTVALLSKIANNSDTSNEHLSSISADSADAQKAM